MTHHLTDDGGTIVLTYVPGEGRYLGHPWADLAARPDGVAAAHSARVITDRLRGYAVTLAKDTATDPALVSALVDLGGRELRHAYAMSAPLDGPGPPVPDIAPLRIEPLDAAGLRQRARNVGQVARLAHGDDGEGWATHDDAADAMANIGAGTVLGPLLPSSTVATREGVVVGACLLVERPGGPPYGGPWVIELFRDPRDPAPGVGGALLASSLARLRTSGADAVGLAVTHANASARRLYARLGFTDVSESVTVLVG